MHPLTLLSLAAGAVPALADTHYFYIGFFSGSAILGVEFDDVASSLTVVNNISTEAVSGQRWLAFDPRQKNVYVASPGYYQSYSIADDLGLTFQSSIDLDTCETGNYVTASTEPPYTAYATPFSEGCPTLAISVDDAGTLQTVFSNATYTSSCGVHGTGLSPDNKFLYSADDSGNAVWVHSIDNTTGDLSMLQYLPADSGSDPRHLAVHPNGAWVYVVYEAASLVAVYSRDTATGLLTFTNTTYSLLPSGYTNSSAYWADEVVFSVPSSNSSSPKYLLAATRSHTEGLTGYVSAFSLDGDTGAVAAQLFLLPTTNSGGVSNAVAPAPWGDERYFGLPDSVSDFVEIWRLAEDGASAAPVAHLDLAAGPANMIWYS